MGKNKYSAPVTGTQPDEATTGTATVDTSTTDVAATDTLDRTSNTEAAGIDALSSDTTATSDAPNTDQEQSTSTLSAEELATVSTGGELEANETGSKGDAAEEEAAAVQIRLDGGVAVEEPGLLEAAAPAPAHEIVSAPVPSPTPVNVTPMAVVVPKPTPVPVVAAPAPIASGSGLANRLELLKKEGSAREKALINFLENYINNMMPGKPVDEKAGATHQQTLWRTLQSVVERSSGDEFRKLFSLALDIFAEHQHRKGAFYDKYVFRFVEHLTFDKDEQKAFLGLLNLLILTANRNTRSIGIKSVDIMRVANTAGFTEQGRQNLISFFR